MRESHFHLHTYCFTLPSISFLPISYSLVFLPPYNCLPFPVTTLFFHQTQFNLNCIHILHCLISTLSHTCTTLHQPISILKTSLYPMYLSPTSLYHVPHTKLQGFYHSTNNCAHSTLPPHDATLLITSQCHTNIGSLTHANELLLIHKYTHTTHLLSV